MTADELKQRRAALRLNQVRYALLLGVTPATYRTWEQGVTRIPAWVAERVAEVEATRWPKRP